MKFNKLFSQQDVSVPVNDHHEETQRVHNLIPEYKVKENSKIQKENTSPNIIHDMQEEISELKSKTNSADEYLKKEIYQLMSRNELIEFIYSQKEQIAKQQGLMSEYKTIAKVSDIKAKDLTTQVKKLKYLLHTNSNSMKFLKAKTEETEIEVSAKEQLIKKKSMQLKAFDKQLQSATNHIKNLEHQLEISRTTFEGKSKNLKEEIIKRYELRFQKEIAAHNNQIIELKTRIQQLRSKIIETNTKLRHQKEIEEEVVNTIRTKFNS